MFDVVIKLEPKAFSTKIKSQDEILLQTILESTQSGFVQELSKELCKAFSKNPDDFKGKTFLALLLACYSPQKPPKKRKISAQEGHREFDRALEIQRMQNAKDTDAMPLDRRKMKAKI